MIADLGPGVSPDLLWLLEVLFDEDGVRVTRGDEPAPSGWRTFERYTVVPDLARARLLLPSVRPAARTALSAYNALRPGKVRASRALVGAAMMSGLGRFAFRDSLSVHVEEERPPLLSANLSETFGRGDVVLAVGVRPSSPYRKPVVQTLTPSGELLGYAKLGWSDLTRGMVTNEAQVLEGLAEETTTGLRVPRPLRRTAWRGQTLLITEPMPRDLRRYESSQGPPAASITRGIAERLGTSSGIFSASAYRSRLVEGFRATREVAEAAGLVGTDRMLAAVSSRHGGTELEFGCWHGDWSPWNLGVRAGELWAWDWEYAGTDVPVGFDPVHFHFQVAFIGRRGTLSDGFEAARTVGRRELEALDLSPAQIEATLDLHGVQVILRYLEAMREGAPENPRFLAGAAEAIKGLTTGER